MPQFFRIVKAQYRESAFDGLGAKSQGGRWNSPGVAMVYASRSRALACLEILVRLPRAVCIDLKFETHVCQIPADCIAHIPKRQHGVRNNRAIGDEWSASAKSLGLLVPSVVIPQEFNILINPNHPDMKRVQYVDIEPLIIDARLLDNLTDN